MNLRVQPCVALLGWVLALKRAGLVLRSQTVRLCSSSGECILRANTHPKRFTRGCTRKLTSYLQFLLINTCNEHIHVHQKCVQISHLGVLDLNIGLITNYNLSLNSSDYRDICYVTWLGESFTRDNSEWMYQGLLIWSVLCKGLPRTIWHT